MFPSPHARAFALAFAVAALACTDSTSPDAVAVASVSVTVPRSAIRVGEKIQAAALPLDASGAVLTGREVTWGSSDNDVASVSSGGLITALKPGAVTITATIEGKNGTTSVAISLVPVTTITVDPPSPTISAGTSTTLTATLKDSAGQVITGRTPTWTTSNPQTASVTQGGVVSGMLIGTADIVASIEGKEAKATVTVNTATTPVAIITLTPSTAAMSGGAKKQLAWTLKDVFGNVITGRTVNFLSSNPSIATVSSGGEVTAAPGDGSVVITASVEGKSATASIDIVTFVRMSAGTDFTCALNTEGTAYCWGDNFNGQLGNGGSANSNLPTKVSTNLKFVAITSGQAHTCAITSGGVAYCWGDNSWGQLGAGTVGQASRAPIAVGGGNTFNSIAGGQNSTCGSTASLDVYCWGQTFPVAQFGPLQPTPRLVGSGMVAVVGGPTTNKYCSVDQAGLGYCWTPDFASASSNQMGSAVSASLHFTTLRVAFTHVCGVVTTGQAYCWGENYAGQLGDGSATTPRSDPTLVSGGLVFESIAVGSGGFVEFNGSAQRAGYSCGVTTGGKGYCWGANISGQLGTGSTVASPTPQPVAGTLAFTGIRAAANHTCGLATNGAAYCWGANSNGKLGDGTETNKPAPTPVFGN